MQHAARLGYRRVVVFPYFLFTGVLVNRIYDSTTKVAEQFPDIEFIKAGYLNDHPLVMDAFTDRVNKILRGENNMNCKLCKYREQVLGFEVEVGLPQESHHHHVEGIGTILHVQNKPASHLITVQGPESLAGYLVPKGSITVDGVSLTIVDVGGPAGSSVDLNSNEFTISLVPHTLKMTTLGNLERGSIVNLEADHIAKYVERLILTKEASHAE